MTEPTRAGYIAGLRALADVLEQHPEVPLPYQGDAARMSIYFLSGDEPREALADAARAMPCRLDKVVERETYRLKGSLAGLKLELVAYQSDVCERVVVGTETVTETVPDPDALAAVPTVEVTHEVERVEWRCTSLLAPTDPPPSGVAVREMGAYDDPSVQAAIRAVTRAAAAYDDTTGSAS